MKNILSGVILSCVLVGSGIFAESFDKISNLKRFENSEMDSWIDLETTMRAEKMDLIKKHKTDNLNLGLKYMDKIKKLSNVSDLNKISDDKLSEMIALHEQHTKEWKNWFDKFNKAKLDLISKTNTEYTKQFPSGK